MKHKETIKALENKHSATINVTSTSNYPVYEVHAKTRADINALRDALKNLIQQLGKDLIFVTTSIPRELHKFVVGKGGANIQKLRKRQDCLYQ